MKRHVPVTRHPGPHCLHLEWSVVHTEMPDTRLHKLVSVFLKTKILANIGDPDETPHFLTRHPGPHCLHINKPIVPNLFYD